MTQHSQVRPVPIEGNVPTQPIGADPLPGPPKHPHLEWSIDLCQTAIFTRAVRPFGHAPEVSGDGIEGYEPGFFELRSAAPIRAMALTDPGAFGEVCRYHYSKRTLGPDGFGRAVVGFQPREGLDPTVKRHFRRTATAYPYVQKELDPNGLAEQGFFFRVSAIHAPFWTEAYYNSKPAICGGIIT